MIVKVFTPTWTTAFNCTANCSSTEVISSLSAGTHYISVNTYSASWQPICNFDEFITVSTGAITPTTDLLYFYAQKDGREVDINWTTNTKFKKRLLCCRTFT